LGLQFQQAQQLWYVVDNDRSGYLDLAEFVRFCSLPQMVQNIMRFEASIPQQSHMVQPQQFPVGHVLFQMLDSKRDGSISFQEFCPLGQQLGIPFQQAQQLWQQVDTDRSNSLNYQEFIRLCAIPQLSAAVAALERQTPQVQPMPLTQQPPLGAKTFRKLDASGDGEYISEPPPQYYQAARQSCLEAFFTCHNFALVLLSCGAISLLVYGALSKSVGFYVGGGVLYLFYVSCFCQSKTAKYLSTKLTPLGAEEYVNDLRRVTPSFTFHVRCWHTETSTSTTTDKDGNTSTSTSTRDVTTYEADEAFVYRRVRDISGALAGISPSDVTRLNIKAEYRFSDEPTRLHT